MMTRLRRYEENVELIFKILYFLLAAGTFCPFIAAANSGENGAGSWRDSSISPGSGLEALHSYAGTVVDGVVRSEFSIVLLYEQKIWNV